VPPFAHPVKEPAVSKDVETIQQFGAKVRRLREQAGLSQSELARSIGMSGQSKGFISEVESGKRIPRADWIVRLARFFGVTTDYLLLDTPLEDERTP
jgi:transcriptional regulator with XRE-family HTH domain